MENQQSKRKTPRWQGFDYNQNGAYFLTICTKERKPILSRITSGKPLTSDQSDAETHPVGTGEDACLGRTVEDACPY